MGIGREIRKNQALLGKWLWRWPLERERLWHEVVGSIHGRSENGWDAGVSRQANLAAPWKAIHNTLPQFLNFIRYEVCSGSSILFWEDIWVGTQPLKDRFPSLYSLSLHKNEPIATFLPSPLNPLSLNWDFGFRRGLRDGESNCVIELIHLLESVCLDPTSSDQRVWTPLPKGTFTCSSFLKSLSSNPSSQGFPVKEVWA